MASSEARKLRAFSQPIEDATRWPRPVCPTCDQGHVAFEGPTLHESGDSVGVRNHEAWEPEWMFGTFHSVGRCENPTCTQEVTATGTYRVGYKATYLDDDRDPYAMYYQVEHFTPALRLFPHLKDTPEAVRNAIERASRVLFLEPNLAATALRAAIETFLTERGIPATSPKGNFIPVDARIQTWQEVTGNERVGNLFRAVKWIGNEGTHEAGNLTISDVLDGAEIIEEALHALFVTPGVDARAHAINASKGLPKTSSPAP